MNEQDYTHIREWLRTEGFSTVVRIIDDAIFNEAILIDNTGVREMIEDAYRQAMESDPMSWLDAEMSRLRAEQRITQRKLDRLMPPAQRLAGFFISKTLNLVLLRCTMCEHEWVRDDQQEHDADCPVGLTFAALADAPLTSARPARSACYDVSTPPSS